MKKLIVFFIFIFICNVVKSQNIYEKYTQNDTLRGQKLWVGVNNLSYNRTVSQYSSLEINLNASYTKWKFTPKNLYYFQVQASDRYNKISSDDNFPNGRRNFFFGTIYGGYSHYLQPKEFYGNISTKLEYYNDNGDFGDNNMSGKGFLFGALGYGRINNAQGLEAAEYFSEALLRTKVINRPLDKSTLLSIDKIIYAYKNGNYGSDYKDDAEIYLMKDIEKVLLEHNAISEKLDAESTMRLFTIFSNRSQKYNFYPRYVGFQTQAEIQYNLFSEIKPKEHFAKISAAYGLPISNNTNFLLNGFYARVLNDDAGNYLQSFPQYNLLPYGEADISNFNFTNNDFEHGNYYNSVIAANKSIVGVNAYLTHTINSTAGIFGTVSYNYYPKNSDIINSEANFLFTCSAGLTYNIYSRLFANFYVSYYKNETVYSQESYVAGVNLNYTIF